MKKFDDLGYAAKAFANLGEVMAKQGDNLCRAGALMADAIENDRLISVYGGGGHTTLVMGEMFFRAGGLANINPIMEGIVFKAFSCFIVGKFLFIAH